MAKNIIIKKSIIFFIGFLFFMQYSWAQNIIDAQKFLVQKKWAQAKESIDGFVLKNPNDGQGFFLKAEIYAAMSKDIEATNLVADAKAESFEALQKAAQINMNYVNNNLKQSNYNLPLNIYTGYQDEAINYYNAAVERKDKELFNQSLTLFKKAAEVGNFIFANGWGLSALDTTNLLYSAKAAINADNETEALYFTKKIADANIAKTNTSKGFEAIYKWLVFYYKQKNDEQNLIKYADSGIACFPSSMYFEEIKIDEFRQQNNYDKLFEEYNILLKKQPNNNKYLLAYCNDMFNYLFANKNLNTKKDYYKTTLENGLITLIAKNPTANDAKLLLAKFYINQASDVKNIKEKQKKYLLQSNNYLLQIINNSSTQNTGVLQLLVGNYRLLNRNKEAENWSSKIK